MKHATDSVRAAFDMAPNNGIYNRETVKASHYFRDSLIVWCAHISIWRQKVQVLVRN